MLTGIGIFIGQNVAAQSGGLGPELVVDGVFNVPADWGTGTGWAITGGQAVATSASADLFQVNSSVLASHTYQVTFTLSGYSSGTVFPYLGSTATFGTGRTANGTYTENITPNFGGELGFHPISSFNGACDNYSVREVLP